MRNWLGSHSGRRFWIAGVLCYFYTHAHQNSFSHIIFWYHISKKMYWKPRGVHVTAIDAPDQTKGNSNQKYDKNKTACVSVVRWRWGGSYLTSRWTFLSANTRIRWKPAGILRVPKQPYARTDGGRSVIERAQPAFWISLFVFPLGNTCEQPLQMLNLCDRSSLMHRFTFTLILIFSLCPCSRKGGSCQTENNPSSFHSPGLQFCNLYFMFSSQLRISYTPSANEAPSLLYLYIKLETNQQTVVRWSYTREIEI